MFASLNRPCRRRTLVLLLFTMEVPLTNTKVASTANHLTSTPSPSKMPELGLLSQDPADPIESSPNERLPLLWARAKQVGKLALEGISHAT